MWLIDKSALVRIADSPDADEWKNRGQRALIGISTPTLLEVGFSARNESDWLKLVKGDPVSWFMEYSITPRAEKRALEVQHELARRGQQRSASMADLLIAAIAETERLTVLHVDKDFDLIADVTGQPIERLRLS